MGTLFPNAQVARRAPSEVVANENDEVIYEMTPIKIDPINKRLSDRPAPTLKYVRPSHRMLNHKRLALKTNAASPNLVSLLMEWYTATDATIRTARAHGLDTLAGEAIYKLQYGRIYVQRWPC